MILKISVHENPHIGLFIKFFEDFAIVSERVEDKIVKRIEESGIKVYRVNIPIIGPYILESDEKIYLSKSVPKVLLDLLKSKLDVDTIEGKKNLLGNIFVVGERGILYSGGADVKTLEDLSRKTKLPIVKLKIRDYPILGGMVKVYKKNCLISQYIPEKYYEKFREVLDVKKIVAGSVNFGSPYVKYGVELNDKIMIVGEKTTGHELLRIEEAFGEYFK